MWGPSDGAEDTPGIIPSPSVNEAYDAYLTREPGRILPIQAPDIWQDDSCSLYARNIAILWFYLFAVS